MSLIGVLTAVLLLITSGMLTYLILLVRRVEKLEGVVDVLTVQIDMIGGEFSAEQREEVLRRLEEKYFEDEVKKK
jgi:hypothetical protein